MSYSRLALNCHETVCSNLDGSSYRYTDIYVISYTYAQVWEWIADKEKYMRDRITEKITIVCMKFGTNHLSMC